MGCSQTQRLLEMFQLNDRHRKTQKPKKKNNGFMIFAPRDNFLTVMLLDILHEFLTFI